MKSKNVRLLAQAIRAAERETWDKPQGKTKRVLRDLLENVATILELDESEAAAFNRDKFLKDCGF